jgi:carnitine-CoA ligase
VAIDMVKDLDRIALPTLLTLRAEEHPERVFLQETGTSPETYAETRASVGRWASGLRALGVRPGEPVLVMLPTSCTSVHVWFALNGIGAIEVPVHNEYRGYILSHLIQTTAPRLIVIGARYLDRLAELGDELGTLERAIVIDGPGDVELPLELVAAEDVAVAGGEGEPLDGQRYNDICSILFTSGTTGPSKGVSCFHAQLQATAANAWPDADPDDAYYSLLPLHHVAGKAAVIAMLRGGGRVVLRERFSIERFWPDIREYGCNTVTLLGAMANFIHRQPPHDDDGDNPCDKVLMLPLIPEVEDFKQRFGVRVRTLFNQTELSAPIATDGYELVDARSCGRVLPGYECRIVDRYEEEVPDGELGELVVRADQPWRLMGGYHGALDKTVEVWRNQWLHTGDGFRRDEDGNLYFVDRFKDVIRRRGENISSVEVELITNQHDDVLESAAVPVPSEAGEDDVKIVVVLKPERRLSEETLLAFLVERMPRFMVPRYVEFVEDLPKTPTQKVRKAELRAIGVNPSTWDRERRSARP